jgi:hypothetical protein
MYYRVAIRLHASLNWHWKSTVLSSLEALFRLLRLYPALPQDRLLVCSSPSREELNEILRRVNEEVESNAITATRFLQERRIYTSPETGSISESGTHEWKGTASIAVALNAWLSESIVTANIPDEKNWNALEQRREEFEHGKGGDHDVPYSFAFPLALPQVRAWMRLLAQVQTGELQP